MNEYPRWLVETHERHKSDPIWLPEIRLFSEYWRLNQTNYVIYLRVSSRAKCRDKLRGQRRHMFEATRAIAGPGKLKRILQEVEVGKLSAHRPVFREAIEYCREHNFVLVARDVSRIIRSETYDHRTNRGAEPTANEYDRLHHELAYGVQLCTVAAPSLTESERLSTAIKGGNCGRPNTIQYPVSAYILHDRNNGMSIRDLANKHNVSPSAVYRFLKTQTG